MEDTVKDFWKMITDYKVSAIVTCCDELEETERVGGVYLDVLLIFLSSLDIEIRK